jgi:hypothetical protein
MPHKKETGNRGNNVHCQLWCPASLTSLCLLSTAWLQSHAGRAELFHTDFHDVCTKRSWPLAIRLADLKITRGGESAWKIFEWGNSFLWDFFPAISKISLLEKLYVWGYMANKPCPGWQFLSDITLSRNGFVCAVVGIGGKRWLKRKSWKLCW